MSKNPCIDCLMVPMCKTSIIECMERLKSVGYVVLDNRLPDCYEIFSTHHALRYKCHLYNNFVNNDPPRLRLIKVLEVAKHFDLLTMSIEDILKNDKRFK